MWDVRMAIKFAGRGETHLLASVRPNIQEMRKFALDYVLKNPSMFRMNKPQVEQMKPLTKVMRVVLGQVSYELSAYSKDDLTKLFTAGSADGADTVMPLVEVFLWPHPQTWASPAPGSVRSPPSSPEVTIID